MHPSREHVVDLLDDYLHDLVSPDMADRVDEHCASCSSCARALAQARRRLDLVRSVPPVEATPGLVQSTLDHVEADRRRRRRRRIAFLAGTFGTLAACLLVLIGASVYYHTVQVSPVDMVVLGQTRLLAATKASLRVRLYRSSGGPVLAGVPVTISLLSRTGQKQELASFVTDELGAGSPRFDVPDWANGNYVLHVSAKTPSGDEVITRPMQLTRSWRLMLSSDKPVYQPGQTILARALALRRPDLHPVGMQDAVFTLTDPRGNVLFKHATKASDFGICSTECQLAQEILEGAYSLACRVGDTESKLSLDVRRYTLPKFKIDVRPDRPYYAPGETARLTVQSDYFFGKPVADAEVQVEVRATDVGERVVQKLTGRTDERGTAKLQFTVPAALVGREPEGAARLRFLVAVTDSAGQKYLRSAERVVTTRPVRFEVIPESGALVQGVSNVVYVLLTRVDGSPVAKADVEVHGDGVNTRVRTDERGAASFPITPAIPQINLTLRATAAGGAVLAHHHLPLLCGQAAGDFLLRTDRAVYRAGATVTLTARGAGVEPVFVDFLKDDQTLLSETVEMNDDKGPGRGGHAFDLPPDLFGTIKLVAYRFTPSGLPLRKVRVLYVAPPDDLKVHATLDKDEYRPGKEATLRLSLTDAKGKPTPGAISLAAVDEAVFSVLAQRPGMEQTFYNLEEDLLKPVYAIYPWMPGAPDDAAQRDRALFASTSRVIEAPMAAQKFAGGPAQSVQPGGPHSLAASSLPDKRQRLEQLRQRRLETVRMGWVFLVLASLAAGYASLWLFLSVGDVLKIHGVAALVIVPLGVLLALATFLLQTRSFMGAKLSKSAATAEAPMASGGGVTRQFRMPVMPPAPADPKGGNPENDPDAGGAPPPRLRQFFPETLLWKPELLTDDDGKLQPLKVTLADSITTWRLAASAVAADGRLGSAQLPVKVFQPFFVDLNLPTSLTRNDEVGVPVVVYNYLPRPQTVTLTLAKAPWFTLTGEETRKLDLAPSEIRSLRFTLKVGQVGTHKLRVTALAGGIGDALEREIEVVPDGRRVEVAQSGSLSKPATMTLDVPANAIPGSVKAFVKLYPSSFSQVVEGLDSIFRMPSGCFEQTSSTTYPNVLALDYLRRSKQSAPQVEAKARQYIHLGYQRLVGFEVPGGGFDWFGRPPANRTLTAYGLMEFTDMARVHDVDPNLIQRTRAWLLAQRKPDGSWDPESHQLHDDVLRADASMARLATTAYIGWAAFSDEQAWPQAAPTLNYLLAHAPAQIDNPHVLALVCNALVSMMPQGKEAEPYLDRLATLRKGDPEHKLAWWEQAGGARTMFYAAGESARIETTALAALALVRGKRHPEAARGALAWLVSKKDPQGTWYSTQATVLSLRALLAGTGEPLGGDSGRQFVLRIGDHVDEVSLPASQAEVMKLLDVSKHLHEGANKLTLEEKTTSAAGYQVVLRYHVPEEKKAEKKAPLTIEIDYDRTELALGDVVKAKATVVNNMAAVAPMVMLDLPVPPGFAAGTEAFEELVGKGTIARYQARPRSVLVYLRGLAPGKPLVLSYTLRATMPVKAAAPGAHVYEYYDPQKQGRSPSTRFVVKEKKD
jgi:hypothetical protein